VIFSARDTFFSVSPFLQKMSLFAKNVLFKKKKKNGKKLLLEAQP